MRKYILDSDLLSKKTTAAYSMLNDMLPVLDKIEETSKEAFEEINAHDELGNVDYTSIKNNMEHIEEYMDKYKAFGAVSSGAGQNSSSGYNYNMSTVSYSSNDGFIGEYQREVDDVFYNDLVKIIKKLRDSKLQDIRIDNNVGIQGERPASIFDMNTKVSDGINKDKIGLEDLLGFGRISMAMHQEYEQIKSQIDAYNASLPKYSSENASKFLPDFISKLIFDSEIDKEKINSCDDYIKKMVTSSDFDYETNGERTASIAADFIPVFGELKMLGEIVEGKDLVSGKHYSTGEQLFGLGTLGAGSLLGKIYKGIKTGMSPEVEEAAGKLSNGTVFAMNGAGGASGIEKLTKNITKKIVGKGEEASEGVTQAEAEVAITSEARSAEQYHTFHQFELKSDFYYASDSVQFRQANKSLIERLNSDASFRKDMFRRNPELKTWLDNNPNLSNSPTGFTWHHSEETGILKLVDRTDHSTNFGIYHPTGNGGRDIWGGGKLGRTGKLDMYGNIKK